MEYVCEIRRSTDSPIFWTFGPSSFSLPLFELSPKPIYGYGSGYFLYFLKESRYTNNLIVVHPPKELTKEQFDIINRKWNECVEKDLFELTFEL